MCIRRAPPTRIVQVPPRCLSHKRALQVAASRLVTAVQRRKHTVHCTHPSVAERDGPHRIISNLARRVPRPSDVTHLFSLAPPSPVIHYQIQAPAALSSSGRRPDGADRLAGIQGKGAAVRDAGSSPPSGPPRAVRRSPPLLPQPAPPQRRPGQPRRVRRSPPLHPQRAHPEGRRRPLRRRRRLHHPLHPEPHQVVPARRHLVIHPEPRQGVPARRHLALLPVLRRLPRRRRCSGGNGGGLGAPHAHRPPRAAVPGRRHPLPALRLPARRHRARGRRAPRRERRAPRRQQPPRRPLRHARRQPGRRHRALPAAPPPAPRAHAAHAHAGSSDAAAHGASRLPGSSDAAAHGASRLPGSSDAAAHAASRLPASSDAATHAAPRLPGSSDAASHGASRLPCREARGAAEEHLHPLHRLPADDQEQQVSRGEASERRLASRVGGRGRREDGAGAEGPRQGEGPGGEVHGRAGVRGVQPGHVQDGAVQQVGGGRGVRLPRPVPVRARHRRAPPRHPPPALQDPALPHGHWRRRLPLRPPLPLPPLRHPRRPPAAPPPRLNVSAHRQPPNKTLNGRPKWGKVRCTEQTTLELIELARGQDVNMELFEQFLWG